MGSLYLLHGLWVGVDVRVGSPRGEDISAIRSKIDMPEAISIGLCYRAMPYAPAIGRWDGGEGQHGRRVTELPPRRLQAGRRGRRPVPAPQRGGRQQVGPQGKAGCLAPKSCLSSFSNMPPFLALLPAAPITRPTPTRRRGASRRRCVQPTPTPTPTRSDCQHHSVLRIRQPRQPAQSGPITAGFG